MAREDADAVVEALRKEIEERKQCIDAMTEDRSRWRDARFNVIQCQQDMDKEKPGTESRGEKEEKLKEYHEELEQIIKYCLDKYNAKTVTKLGSQIYDRSFEIKRLEERLQLLEGKQKHLEYLEGHGSQSSQEQGGHTQQRIKGVAETQASFMRELEKHYELVQPPDAREESKDTVNRKETFDERRERIKMEVDAKKKEQQKDLSRGREGRDILGDWLKWQPRKSFWSKKGFSSKGSLGCKNMIWR